MTSWSNEETETLKGLWKDGLSAGQIVKRMPGKSRNAIIGKVHRIGLEKRKSACRVIRLPKIRGPVRRKGRWANSHAPAPMFSSEPMPPEPPMPMTALRLTLMQLTNATCKCGLGDPKDPDFAFCGLPTVEGSVYCATHKPLMYAGTKFKPNKAKGRKVQPPIFEAAHELYERIAA